MDAMTAPDLIDHVDGMRAAIVELGYDPHDVHYATDDDARRYPGVDVMVSRRIPADVAWKAGALIRLSVRGADSPSRCLAASGPSWHLPCPKHPVGALLAGTDPGCTP